ncbi:MAG TPA: DUF1566 domain-containing protein, partial [Pyrodictium sp.]|nr:DUF1566 domain-containing protein [Pyrodictium sp.]
MLFRKKFFLFLSLLILGISLGYFSYALIFLEVGQFLKGTPPLINQEQSCPVMVIEDGLLKDQCTGLYWKGQDEGVMTWDEAKNLCNGGNFRLPNIDELYSLVNHNNLGKIPIISNGTLIYKDVPLEGLGTYWSATEYRPDSDYARSVNFINGTTDNLLYSKDIALNVYCIANRFCGNGKIESGEECDGAEIDTTCQKEGYLGGAVACQDCQIVTDACFQSYIFLSEAGKSCQQVCEKYGVDSSGKTCQSEETNCQIFSCLSV